MKTRAVPISSRNACSAVLFAFVAAFLLNFIGFMPGSALLAAAEEAGSSSEVIAGAGADGTVSIADQSSYKTALQGK